MKILHLIQKRQLRGAEVFTSQLSNQLNSLGHEAIIVPLFNGNAALPFEGKIIELKASASKKYWDVEAWKRLARIIDEEKPDIIQANAGDTLKYAQFSKIFFGWKQPIVFRNASTISLYIKGTFVKSLYRYLFNRTHKIISVSYNSANDFETLFPACKNKITVIPIGIEMDKAIEQKTSPNPFKNITGNGPVLIHVGGFSFEKNHKGLVAIFKRILRRFPKATLHLVGEGPLRKETEALIAGENLSGQVFFHGYQKEPLQWIQYADALLLPSIIEGLPGVILEAFYCRTPVVAFNTGGIKEIVISNETGYLVPLNDNEAFAEAVENLLSDSQKTNQLVENAYEMVMSQYTNTQVAKRFVDIYKKLTTTTENKKIKVPVTQL